MTRATALEAATGALGKGTCGGADATATQPRPHRSSQYTDATTHRHEATPQSGRATRLLKAPRLRCTLWSAAVANHSP